LEKVVFQEIPLRMLGWYTPPVVGESIENTENDNEEGCGPFGFETDGHHGAGGKSEDGDEQPGNGPFTLNDESEEEEDEKDTTRQEEVFPSIGLANGRKSGEEFFTSDHGVAEDHEETTNDAEVTEEESEVEDETVAETLDDDDGQKTGDSVF